MITLAYKVENPSTQLTGLPKWAKDQSFSIAAKPAAGFPLLSTTENLEQVRLMLRAMLAERFSLRLHTETRRETIFALELAKNGIGLKQVDPPVPPAREHPVGAAIGDDSGRMIGAKSTMAGLARALEIFLKHPVSDKTGLAGFYDFDIHWSAPEGQPPSRGLGTEGIGLLISNVQWQLGLRLRQAVGPVDYWVVDHVEPPTDN